MTAHIHAEAMRLYAEDAAETDKPWERWESRRNELGFMWRECVYTPDWETNFEYRRIPRTINIGGIEVPAPEREVLSYGDEYFLVHLLNHCGLTSSRWYGSSCDFEWLQRGVIYRRKEDAQACADALIKLLTGGRDD